MTSAPEKQWRPVEPPSSTPGVYFDDPKPENPTWSWKLPAWMTADWPEADETAPASAWWWTFVVCLLALALVVASLRPWTWQ